MEIQGITFTIGLLFGMSLVFSSLFKMTRYAFFINLILTVICLGLLFKLSPYLMQWVIQLLYIGCPLLLINTVLYVFLHKENEILDSNDKHQVHFKVKGGSFKGISKKHSKLIKANSQVVYYNHEKLMKKIPLENFRRREREAFELMKEYNCEDILMTSSNKNGNLIGEGFINTPNEENNGGLYLFNYINRVIEFGKY